MGFSLSKGLGYVGDKFFGKAGQSNPYNAPNLVEKNFFDYYNPNAAPAFEALIKNIGTESDIGKQRLSSLLTDVDTDTAHSVGSLKSDFLERGLGGPGQLSTPEATGLAQAYSTGDKTKTDARLGLLQQQLAQLTAAYGGQYQTLAGGATNAANGYNALLRTQADAYNSGANRKIQSQQPGFFDYFGQAWAKKAGDNAAGPSSEDVAKLFMMGG